MRPAFENPTRDTLRAMMDCFLYDGPARYTDEDLLLAQRVEAWRSRPDQREAWRNSQSIQRDLTADLHKIEVPVLQIHGRNDRVAPLESALRLLNLLPDSRLMIFNHCGHWVPFERPDEFCRLVTAFLSPDR
jgi:pimeloyl-ACP methyl ester carboxylesterase